MKWLLPRIALMIGGILLSLGLVLLCLTTITDLSIRHFFQLLIRPGGERYIMRTYDGDTFIQQPGLVRPPQENEVLEDVIRYYDDSGFREPQDTADYYPIIALGDSFTEGGAVPWVDVLADELDTPVQNLGWRGWGPLEYAAVMDEFGGDNHEWVLIAYFEGNDLSNIKTSYDEYISGTLNIERSQEPPPFLPTVEAGDPDEFYLYPFVHFVGNNAYDIAYISYYLWWNNGSEAVYRQSRNIAVLRETLQAIQRNAGDACVALVYIPSKERLYFPYSYDKGNRNFLLEHGYTLMLDPEGWLDFEEGQLTFEAVTVNLDNQSNVIREVSTELGIHFIDLMPAFEEEIFRDELFYYPYDSHWNQAGHDLAGQTVADYIREFPCE